MNVLGRLASPGKWWWRVLGFFVLAALGALVAIVVSGRASGTPSLVATQPPTVTTTPKPVHHPSGGLVPWPNRDGYTVVLQSLPTSATRANAVRTAKQAIAAGLKDVGVLDSAAYSSLHPGYYVVFAGIYPSSSAAGAAVSAAHAAGFPAAYARPVTR